MMFSLCGSVFAEDTNPTPVESTQVTQQEANAKAIVEQLKAQIEASQQQEQLDLNEFSASLRTSETAQTIAPLGLTKTFYRAEFATGAGILVTAGFKLTGALLAHSLSDSPSDVSASAGSEISDIVHSATALQNLVKATKAALPSNSNYYVSPTTSLVLNSPTDVFLSLNKVNVLQAAEKVGSTWTIYTRISDTYNFEKDKFTMGSGIPGTFVTLVNNYAVAAQNAGAIVPYQVTVFTQDTKKFSKYPVSGVKWK